MRALHVMLALGVVVLAWSMAQSPDESPLRADPDRDEPGQADCPMGPGPAMARLPEGFCIDTTEVTRGDYAAWLAGDPDPSLQTGACVENTDFTPSCAFEPGRDEAHPVVCVDWCDAKAYCEAAGKRLCGRIGGGDYAHDDYDDPAVSEWQAACSSGGANEYTYGNTLDTAVCRGADAADHTEWGLEEVGSFPDCRSPDAAYPAVLDLSGHVAEWDGACDGDEPGSACRIRGGSYEHNEHGLRCAMGSNLRWPRDRAVSSVGFRCCAD